MAGRDDDGDVRANHEHATNRSQMMKTTFTRGNLPNPWTARTHRHVCTCLGVAGTFYTHWQPPPLQRKKRREDPSYTARKRPTVFIVIRTSDIKQDTGLAETVAMVAGQSSDWGQ